LIPCFFNAWINFLSAAESVTKVCIVANGASNGGLLVGAAVTQKPELFGAALPDVGVLDMVRYNRLDGTSWVSDFGDVNDKAQFEVIKVTEPVDPLAGPCRGGRQTLGARRERVVPAM